MYVVKFIQEDAVPLDEGILDMNTCIHTHDFEDEQVWRSLYFVGGSQLSMYLDSIY